MRSKAVNRSLKDQVFNQIDHALGRPVNPMGETYRDFFSTSFDSPVGQEMAKSPYWEPVSSSDGSVTGFCVTEEGRRALCEHLLEIGDKHKTYDVYIDATKLDLDPASEPMKVVAESNGKARAAAWREISETFEDITFRKFMGAIKSVRISDQIELEPDAPGMSMG